MRKFKTESGLVVFVGENAKENDLIRKLASQRDIWFHLENTASPHVILSLGKDEPSRNDVYECSQLCKYFSKQKNKSKSSVIYTTVKKVKKVPEIDGRCELKAAPYKIEVYYDDDVIARLMKTEFKS